MRKVRLSLYGMNMLDHFDSALYGFLVPVLAPLFFPKSEPVLQLIYGYSVMVLGLIMRPLGAWVFGRLAQHSPSHALIKTLQGMNASMLIFSILPLYESVGGFAPLFLVMVRGFQSFFAAGENCIASLYLMDVTPPSKRYAVTRSYQVSVMLGILAACAVATLITSQTWRIPFALSAFLGTAALALRSFSKSFFQDRSFLQPQISSIEWKSVLRIIPLGGIAYILYGATFILPITLVPLVTSSVSQSMILSSNVILMVVDTGLIILLGRCMKTRSAHHLLGFFLLSTIFLGPVLFWSLSNASLSQVLCVRSTFMILGVGFSIPLYRFYFETLNVQQRFQGSAMGHALGTEIFGRSFPAVGLWIWHTTHDPVWIGVYVSALALLGGISVFKCHKDASCCPHHFLDRMKGRILE